MNVIEVNEGPKIDYEVRKTKITFGDDELTLNLARLERDDDISVDICIDEYGILHTGLAREYVAQIEIPARQYDMVEKDNPDYDPEDETSQKVIQEKIAVPFSMDNVTLKLYSI